MWEAYSYGQKPYKVSRETLYFILIMIWLNSSFSVSLLGGKDVTLHVTSNPSQ